MSLSFPNSFSLTGLKSLSHQESCFPIFFFLVPRTVPDIFSIQPKLIIYSCCSVTKSCLTLCDPMDCSAPDLSVPQDLPEFTQVHVHWISDVIQPSHPLLAFSPFAFNLSQHQGLFRWLALCIRWPKYWIFSFSISPSNEYSGLISFRTDWFAIQGVWWVPTSSCQ